MEIRTKYKLGDILTSKGSKYVGKVTKIEVTIEGNEVDESSVIYTLEGNERTSRLKEQDVFRLQLVSEA